MDELLLGLDVGTSGSRAVLAQPDGAVVATAERAHGTSLPRPGWVEHDAEAVWWADVLALLAELGRGRLRRVAGVCVSGIGPCLLPLDAGGAPLRPAILYGIDTRAGAEAAELTERYGADEILEVGGSPLTSQAVGPKLLWLRRHEPEVWGRTRRFAMASSFAVLRLSGEYVLDHHSASQCNPLYDLGRARWRDDCAAEIAMFLVHVAPAARPAPTLWLTAGVAPASRTVAAGLATAGALTSWLRELAGGPSFEQLLTEAGAVPPGADGLVVLPYFAGERTPLFDADARGAVLGLTLRHGRGHVYRALLEATALGVRHNLEAIEEACGGLWAQIVSDATGREQDLPEPALGASYGDAQLAGAAAGLAAPDAPWARAAGTVRPRPELAPLYDELYGVYRRLYPATRGLAHELAALQTRAVG